MKVLLLALFLICGTVQADCPNLYPYGKTIDIPDTVELCNAFYVVRYNEKKKAAIISAEVLQPAGHTIPRSNNFTPDHRIKNSPKHSTYTGSGYDRGHLTPAADATTFIGMSETFLMTNMTPQAPMLNRGAWKELEEDVRRADALAKIVINVMTGAVYNSNETMNGIPVPTGYFKVVYLDPLRVYYADNKDDAVVQTVTLDYLKAIGATLE